MVDLGFRKYLLLITHDFEWNYLISLRLPIQHVFFCFTESCKTNWPVFLDGTVQYSPFNNQFISSNTENKSIRQSHNVFFSSPKLFSL